MNFKICNSVYGTISIAGYDDALNMVGWTSDENSDYLTWLAEGNTPEEWKPDGNN